MNPDQQTTTKRRAPWIPFLFFFGCALLGASFAWFGASSHVEVSAQSVASLYCQPATFASDPDCQNFASGTFGGTECAGNKVVRARVQTCDPNANGQILIQLYDNFSVQHTETITVTALDGGVVEWESQPLSFVPRQIDISSNELQIQCVTAVSQCWGDASCLPEQECVTASPCYRLTVPPSSGSCDDYHDAILALPPSLNCPSGYTVRMFAPWCSGTAYSAQVRVFDESGSLVYNVTDNNLTGDFEDTVSGLPRPGRVIVSFGNAQFACLNVAVTCDGDEACLPATSCDPPTPAPTPEPTPTNPNCALCDDPEEPDRYKFASQFVPVHDLTDQPINWREGSPGQDEAYVNAEYELTYEPCEEGDPIVVTAFPYGGPEIVPAVNLVPLKGTEIIVISETREEDGDCAGLGSFSDPSGAGGPCRATVKHVADVARRVQDADTGAVYILEKAVTTPPETPEHVSPADPDCQAVNAMPRLEYELVSSPVAFEWPFFQGKCDWATDHCFLYRYDEFEVRELLIDADVACINPPTCAASKLYNQGSQIIRDDMVRSTGIQQIKVDADQLFYRNADGSAHGWDLGINAIYDDGSVSTCGLTASGDAVEDRSTPGSASCIDTDPSTHVAIIENDAPDGRTDPWFGPVYGVRRCAAPNCGELYSNYFAVTKVRTVRPNGNGGFATLVDTTADLDVKQSATRFNLAFTSATIGASSGECRLVAMAQDEDDPSTPPTPPETCVQTDEIDACNPNLRKPVHPCLDSSGESKRNGMHFGDANHQWIQVWFSWDPQQPSAPSVPTPHPPGSPPVLSDCSSNVPAGEIADTVIAQPVGMPPVHFQKGGGPWPGYGDKAVPAALQYVGLHHGGDVYVASGDWETDVHLSMWDDTVLRGASLGLTRLRKLGGAGIGTTGMVYSASVVEDVAIHDLSLLGEGLQRHGVNLLANNSRVFCTEVDDVKRRGIFFKEQSGITSNGNLIAANRVSMPNPDTPPVFHPVGVAVAGTGNTVHGTDVTLPAYVGTGVIAILGGGNSITQNEIPAAGSGVDVINSVGNQILGNTIGSDTCSIFWSHSLANETDTVFDGNTVKHPNVSSSGPGSWWQCLGGGCSLPGLNNTLQHCAMP